MDRGQPRPRGTLEDNPQIERASLALFIGARRAFLREVGPLWSATANLMVPGDVRTGLRPWAPKGALEETAAAIEHHVFCGSAAVVPADQSALLGADFAFSIGHARVRIRPAPVGTSGVAPARRREENDDAGHGRSQNGAARRGDADGRAGVRAWHSGGSLPLSVPRAVRRSLSLPDRCPRR
jgi:hypothetical protein